MGDRPAGPSLGDFFRGAFTGVFALVWICGAGGVGAIGYERSPALALVAGLVGATAGFVILVEAMNVPRRRAAGWLLFVLVFATVAGFGTALSPFGPSARRWRAVPGVGAALFAAALAGAVLLTERSRPSP